MNKEELLLRKRMIDLSKTASMRGFSTFSDFLNLNQQNIVLSTPKELFFSPYETFGGVSDSERQMVRFLPDALSLRNDKEMTSDWPIAALKIIPSINSFQSLPGHRDYLGALLNLGIDRSTLGDILILDSTAVLFAKSSIAGYIKDELNKVRHTKVRIEEIELDEFSYEPKLIQKSATVASIRLDSLMSVAFPSSRSKLVNLIQGGRVSVNGKIIISNSFHLKEDDIISVRGLGRFIYNGIKTETKKGRFYVNISLYDK